jgi:hypothetical protein
MSDPQSSYKGFSRDETVSTTIPATVEKIIKPRHPGEPEKAEVVLHDGEPFYREIRIENKLKTEDGEDVKLKPGATVEVTVQADPTDTEKVAPQ